MLGKKIIILRIGLDIFKYVAEDDYIRRILWDFFE